MAKQTNTRSKNTISLRISDDLHRRIRLYMASENLNQTEAIVSLITLGLKNLNETEADRPLTLREFNIYEEKLRLSLEQMRQAIQNPPVFIQEQPKQLEKEKKPSISQRIRNLFG